MQELGPDMEELFRKAAANYPLNPGDDNWELVHSKLLSTEMGDRTKKRNYRKYFVLVALLLLFLSLGLGFFIITTRNKGNQQSGFVGNKESENKNVGMSTMQNPRRHGEKFGKQSIIEKIMARERGELKTIGGRYQEIFPAADNVLSSGKIFAIDFLSDEIAESKLISENFTETLLLTSPFVFPHVTNPESAGTKLQDNKRSFGKLYYGFFGGASLSSVKTSGITKTGYEIGLLGGYRVSDKFSLEGAFSFSKRPYPSKGKYFDGKNMPQGMDVMELQGCSYVFQLPVQLRYDVNTSGSKKIFLSSGITSYLLLTEHNNYDLMVNGAAQEMDAMYKKDKDYVAAAIQFTIGYEKTINHQNKIRVEPFIQIPLRGIGVGELPVTTAGVRLGLRRGSD